MYTEPLFVDGSSRIETWELICKNKGTSITLNESHTTRDSGNVQFHDQEESKLNSTINVNSGARTYDIWENNK